MYQQLRRLHNMHETATLLCIEMLVEFHKYLPSHVLASEYVPHPLCAIFRHESWCVTLFH